MPMDQMAGMTGGGEKMDKMAGSEAESPEKTEVRKRVEEMLAKARSDGTLAPLEKFITDEGIEATAEDLVLAAQTNEATRGKSPQELVQMFQEDPGLVEDLLQAAGGEVNGMPTSMLEGGPGSEEMPGSESESASATPPPGESPAEVEEAITDEDDFDTAAAKFRKKKAPKTDDEDEE